MKVRLGEICIINMGQSPESTSYNAIGDGIPFFQGNADFGELYPTVRVYCNAPTKIAHAGDILISVRAPIGALNVADRECCIGRGLAALTVNDSICSRQYLWYGMASKVGELNSKGTGSTFKAVNKKVLADTEMVLPDLTTQCKITSILEKIDGSIAFRKQQIQKLDELVKARFVEMFKGKYPLIKVSGKLKTTSGGTPKSSIREYYDGGDIPWLTSGEVNYGDILKPSNFITEEGLNNSSAKWVPKNSVVIAMYGATAGKVGIVRYETTTNQAVCSVLPNEEYNQEYLRYAFLDISAELASKAIGGGQPNISQTVIKDSYIINAPRDMQDQFAGFVAQVDKSKLSIQAILDQLEILRQSLMQKYFG